MGTERRNAVFAKDTCTILKIFKEMRKEVAEKVGGTAKYGHVRLQKVEHK